MSRVSKSTNTSTSKSANQQSPILHDMPTTPLTKVGTNLFQLMLVATCCSWIFRASSIRIIYTFIYYLHTHINGRCKWITSCLLGFARYFQACLYFRKIRNDQCLLKELSDCLNFLQTANWFYQFCWMQLEKSEHIQSALK